MQKMLTHLSLLLLVIIIATGTVIVIVYQSQSLNTLNSNSYSCSETLSAFEQPLTKEQALEAIGFTHPELTELFEYYDKGFEFQCSTIYEKTYVAISIGERQNQLRLYEVNNNEAKVIYSTSRSLFGEILNFGDRNLNGYIDFAYTNPDLANGHCPAMTPGIEYIEYDGNEWTNVPPTTPSWQHRMVYSFSDLRRDGITDISGRKYYSIPGLSRSIIIDDYAYCGRRILYRYYSWDSNTYTLAGIDIGDDSDNIRAYIYQPERFQSNAGYYPTLKQIADEGDCSKIISIDSEIQIYDTLLYHYGWDRLDDGWIEVQPMLDAAATCENKVVIDVDFFETVEAFRTYFADLS